MICARFDTTDMPVIIGLSADDIEALRRGAGIPVKLQVLGIKGMPELYIVHEPTEQQVLDKLKNRMSRNTTIVFADSQGNPVDSPEGTA